MNERKRSNLIALGIVFSFFILWELLVHLLAVPVYLLPAPSRVLRTLFENTGTYLDATILTLGEALVGMPIQVSYRPGWAADVSLQEALKHSVARDRLLGTTQAGPHRAELGVRLGGEPVREHASRGQQKLVSAALTLV